MEAEPPPESYWVERLTVATPFFATTLSRVVRSGIAVEIRRSADSARVGPASKAVTAALATAVDLGTSRSTGTRPAVPGSPPRTKYARTIIVSPVAGVAVVVGPVGTDRDGDASDEGSVDGAKLALGAAVRAGPGGSTDGGGGGVGTAPRPPGAPPAAGARGG